MEFFDLITGDSFFRKKGRIERYITKKDDLKSIDYYFIYYILFNITHFILYP